MKIQDNRIIVDLKKVSYAKLYWKNQYGQRRDTKLDGRFYSVRSDCYSKDGTDRLHNSGQLLYEYAKERGLLDVWIPHLYLQLSNSHSLTYSGKKAVSLYEAYCSLIFSKKKT